MRTQKTAKSAQTDIYYLCEAFGPICPQLQVTSRRLSPAARKRPLLLGARQDLRRQALVIEANCFEQITTAQISGFITGQVQSRGLAPKTANRYREILCRLFNWAMEEGGVRLPADKNPVLKVTRYKEHAPEIRFLTLAQVDEQLAALADHPQLQTMVAVLIYAGLRREEVLWLIHDDVDLNTGTLGMLRIRAKTVDGESWQPKTKVNRAVPISSTLRGYLDAYRPRIVPGGWFFPSPDGKRWDPDNFSADLRTANEKAHLPWGCLDYRHTFGSQLAMKGESLYKISTLMGNSPEICRRHYAAIAPASLEMAVEFPAHSLYVRELTIPYAPAGSLHKLLPPSADIESRRSCLRPAIDAGQRRP
jgi:integrase